MMQRYRATWMMVLGVVASIGLMSGMAKGADEKQAKEDHAAKAREVIAKGVAYLRTQQDANSGGWAVPKPAGGSDGSAAGEPHYPAITGLVLQAMMADGTVKQDDPAIQMGMKYLLNHQQADGGIYDRILPSYNTSIAVSALSRIDSGRAKSAMLAGVEFLKKLQYSEASVRDEQVAESPNAVGKEHPFYGGVGYGKHGRPDNSNLNLMMQALQDAGVSGDDPAVQRALTFLQRTQMLGSVNDMPYAKGSKQGGFIYATVENAQSVDGLAGQSMAKEPIEETLDDGTKVSRLRCYGSVTYAGFKTYIYANLAKDDPRVRAAYDWLRRHYSVEENPGVGQEGLYYYYVTMAKALRAWGEPAIEAVGTDGAAKHRRWSAELIDRLASMQNEDGSFKSVHARWMEGNPVLITAYALIALGEAEKMERATGGK